MPQAFKNFGGDFERMQPRLLIMDVRGGDDFICAGVIEQDFDLAA